MSDDIADHSTLPVLYNSHILKLAVAKSICVGTFTSDFVLGTSSATDIRFDIYYQFCVAKLRDAPSDQT